MKRRVLALLFCIVMTVGVYTPTFASVKFYNAADGFRLTEITNEDEVYAVFDAEETLAENSNILVAKSADNRLTGVDFLEVDEVSENQIKTLPFTVSAADRLELLALESLDSVKPLLTGERVIFRRKDTLEKSNFKVKLPNTDKYLYRVGNKNAVSLGSLFEAVEGALIKSENVQADVCSFYGPREVKGTITYNKLDWTKSEIQFEGTGLVKVVIRDKKEQLETGVYLEVVEAKNITSAVGSKGTDVVLLNNVKVYDNSMASYTDCTVYGNGFTFDVRGGMNQYNSKQGHGIIIIKSATLDNLVVLGDVYDTYGAYTDQKDYTSAIDAENSTLQNCHISNCSAPVRGNGVTIKNTTLYGGTVANLILSGGVNTLEDVTTVNYNDGRGVLGFGIVISDGANENVKLILNGQLKQHNFVCADDSVCVPDQTAKKLFNAMFDSAYNEYHFNSNGKIYVNPGILSMVSTFDKFDITNNTGNSYDGIEVSYNTGLGTAKGYLYSLPARDNNLVNNEYNAANDSHKSNKQADYLPIFDFSLGNQAISNDGADDTRYLTENINGVEALYQNNESPVTLDLTKLAMVCKYNGVNYPVNVSYKDAVGNVIGTNTTVSLTSSGTLEFTVTDNVFYDKNGEQMEKNLLRTYIIPLTVSVKQAAVKNATVTIKNSSITGKYTKAGTFDDSQYLSFNPLDAVKVTDYDVSGTGTTVDLAKNIKSTEVKYVNTSNGAWGGATITMTYTDGRILTIVLGSTSINSPGASNGGKTITVTNGAVKSDGKVAKSSATGGTWPIISYSFKGNNGSTVTTNQTVNVDFSNVNSGSGGECITPDTLITLADGRQVRVDSLKGDEKLLIWNMETGSLDSAPIMFVDSDAEAESEIIHLYFSDGTDVKVIYEHGFWDYELNRYVYLDRNAKEYIGHRFAKQSGRELKKVALTDVVIEKELTTAWSPVTEKHLCYFVNGMLSMPGGVGGLFNIFDVVPEAMHYDFKAIESDIQKYGLFTYDELNSIAPLSKDMFEQAGGAYLKISIGKGNLTMDELVCMINRYSKFFN